MSLDAPASACITMLTRYYCPLLLLLLLHHKSLLRGVCAYVSEWLCGCLQLRMLTVRHASRPCQHSCTLAEDTSQRRKLRHNNNSSERLVALDPQQHAGQDQQHACKAPTLASLAS